MPNAILSASESTKILLREISVYGEVVLQILGAIIAIGIAYLIFSIGWQLIRNMPGDFGYNSQRASYRFGHGKVIKPHSGNMLE